MPGFVSIALDTLDFLDSHNMLTRLCPKLSHAIKDVATDEFIVPFSAYTSMSCDTNGMYFNQWLDGFYPDRVYKIQLKLKYDDEQEQVFDDDFEFIVKRK